MTETKIEYITALAEEADAAWLPIADGAPADELIRTAAWNALKIPRNATAALQRHAAVQGLGAVLTAEVKAGPFTLQGFALGIVACRTGEWNRVWTIRWN